MESVSCVSSKIMGKKRGEICCYFKWFYAVGNCEYNIWLTHRIKKPNIKSVGPHKLSHVGPTWRNKESRWQIIIRFHGTHLPYFFFLFSFTFFFPFFFDRDPIHKYLMHASNNFFWWWANFYVLVLFCWNFGNNCYLLRFVKSISKPS